MLNFISRGAARLLAAVIAFVASSIFVYTAGALGLILVFAVPLIVVAIHEFGHAIAASTLGMNVSEISVGPIAYFPKLRRFGWNRRVFGYDVGGHVTYDDSKGRYLTRSIDRLIALAGPAANLLSGGAAYITRTLLLARWRSDAPAHRLCVCFACCACPFRLAVSLGIWSRKRRISRTADVRFQKPVRPQEAEALGLASALKS